MNRLSCLVGCMLLAASLAASALAQDGPGGLSAAEIVERNAAARGGVPAWQKLQTLAWAGHTEINSVPGRQMPMPTSLLASALAVRVWPRLR